MVVINLGTNDFSTKPFPDKNVFEEAYNSLINRVRLLYSHVTIFCVSGPMIGEHALIMCGKWSMNSSKMKAATKTYSLLKFPIAI
jgi:hypothetical protein